MGNPESVRYVNVDDALALVNKHALEMAGLDEKQERGYAHLGWLLLEVAEMQYWRVRYPTFREYLNTVAQISRKTVPQLQRYFLTVRDLSDVFTREQMESMGVTKACLMRQAKDYALVLPAELIAAALDSVVTAKELKAVIAKKLRLPKNEEGIWITFEFLVNEEEGAIIDAAVGAAKRIDPEIKPTIAESAQIKEVVLRWCMDFLGTYGGNAV